jgi:hypothetical protein
LPLAVKQTNQQHKFFLKNKKPPIMKKQILPFVLLLLNAAAMQAQTYLLKDDGNNGTTNSAAYEDGTGNIGIGYANPTAKLHVLSAGFDGAIIAAAKSGGIIEIGNNDIFIGRRDVFSTTYVGNPPVIPYETLDESIVEFIIKGDGKVGIGTALPESQFNIVSKPLANPNDPLDNPAAFLLSDHNNTGVIAMFNTSQNGFVGGGIGVIGYNDPNYLAPALFVMDENGNRLPFAVGGNGLIAAGHDVTNGFSPLAQIDFRKYNDYDYMLNIGDQNGISGSYFNINNEGNIGIGTPANTNSTLLMRDAGGSNTKLDLVSLPDKPAYLRLLSGTSTIRHQITEANGDLVIDAGMQNGGANDKLMIESSAAVRGRENTNLDLYRVSATGWDGQIRWVANNQYRHLMYDNEGTLTIDPGYANGNDLLAVKGDETISGDERVLGKLMVGTNTTISGTEIVAIDGKVRIGDPLITNSNYSSAMLSVEGLIICNRAVVKVNEWQDKVFDPSYKLMSIDKVNEYVTKHRHLPDIPAEKEVLDEGISIGEMNALLLKKIEELTLYTIELNKRVADLEKK